MRIGIDARNAASAGGIGRYTFDLVRSLGRYGTRHSYTAVVDRAQDTTWIPATIKTLSVRGRVKRFLPVIWEHGYFPSRLRSQGFDLMHFPHLNVPLTYYQPFVTTAHDISIYTHPEWFAPGQWWSKMFVVPGSIKRAQQILAISPDVASRIRSRFHVDPRRLSIIPNGVDVTRFVPAAHPTRDYLLYVGSAAPYKNVPLLNAIIEQAGIRCVVVGAAAIDFRRALRGRTVSAHFSFTPRLEFGSAQLVALYQNARGLLQPSIDESFALPILESLACGTPVIAADIPSLRAVYGEVIRYASLDDVGRWLDWIRQLPVDHQPTSQTQQTLVTEHSWSALVGRLETLYSSVAP
ncbi:MAG: glycosyltransferase family 4 protein [Candidatus Kerfeldbacteria bacterium]|nr:glycosyltransferase family 4 protein [Candidatus Kerfeldbacteria bacterium]